MNTPEKSAPSIIEKLKKRRGLWTQEAIADRLTQISGRKIYAKSVSQWATGEHAPSPNNLQRLLDLLDEQEDTTFDGPERNVPDRPWNESVLIASKTESVYIGMLLRILRSNHARAKEAVCQNLDCFSELVDIVESKKGPVATSAPDVKRKVGP